MINIDNRLVNGLNGYELAVFAHILKRIDKTNKCFPSRQLLQKETGFGREKIAEIINSLIKKNIIETHQEKTEGKFGKTVYIIKTDLAGVYISAKNEILKEECRNTENRNTVLPLSEKSTVSINHNLSINQIKEETPPIFIDEEKPKLLKGRDLYISEIEKNLNSEYIKEYKRFFEFLTGKNIIEEELVNILKIPKQVTYLNFVKLYLKSIEVKKKFSDLLPKMENDKKYTAKQNLYLTLNNWLENKY